MVSRQCIIVKLFDFALRKRAAVVRWLYDVLMDPSRNRFTPYKFWEQVRETMYAQTLDTTPGEAQAGSGGCEEGGRGV